MRLIRARPRRVVVVVAILLLVGVIAGSAAVAISHTSSRPAASSPSTSPTATSPATATATSTVSPTAPSLPGSAGTQSNAPSTGAPAVQAAELSLTSSGVQSRTIVAENARPGAKDWRIANAPATGYAQGWASKSYAKVGDNVDLYVSTTAAQYEVTAYRMGYYGGDGAREIWKSTLLPGHIQPPCPVIDPVKINMVSCTNWSLSLTMPVTADFVQGQYLLKFTGVGGEQSYAPLTVWDPASTATYLFESHPLTAAAWNDYGGYSFYIGIGPCPVGAPSYPTCNRARVVSLDRPYAEGGGAGDFFDNEYPFLKYMEQHGLDVAYVNDILLDSHPEAMLDHKAFLSLGHDETWTYAGRKGVEAAAAKGVNVAFMSAAAMVRHARLQPSSIGAEREVVEYRDSNEDPDKDPQRNTGNTWAVPPTTWPVNSFIGQQYSGYLHPGTPNAAFVVHDATAWIYKDTGLTTGATIPDVIGSDIDHLDTATTPANTQVLGHSPISLNGALTNQGKWGNYTYSDMTYYTDPKSHAGIFDSGAVSWIAALDRCPSPSNCPATAVQQMTGNLLWLFGQGPAGNFVTPNGNWKGVTPAGS